jgi:hypothetical protein
MEERSGRVRTPRLHGNIMEWINFSRTSFDPMVKIRLSVRINVEASTVPPISKYKISVTLEPRVPDNNMCKQLVGKTINNKYHHITITCLDLKSWHSGPK